MGILHVQITLIMEEEFRDIKGYEGLYQVSNLGRIKSLRRNKLSGNGCLRKTKEKILITPKDKYGYPNLKLSKLGIKKHFTVHRLVAMSFIENEFNKPTVNHKDGIKTNNRVDNLEWATLSEQIVHSLGMGLRTVPNNKGRKRGVGKLHNRSKPIRQSDLNGNFVRDWECAKQAKREGGFTPTHISRCCKGLASSHKGFKFSFV